MRFQGTQTFQIVGRSKRTIGNRAGAGCDIDSEAHGVRRHDDVAVQNGGVDSVAANRLQRDLGGQVRLFDRLKNAAVATDGLVFGETATGLAHEPHRSVVRCRPARRGQKSGVSGVDHHL